MKVLKAAVVPEHRRHDGISVLTLVDDTADSGGFFLYMHEKPGAPYRYDAWYESLDEAMESASKNWGISEGAWQSSR